MSPDLDTLAPAPGAPAGSDLRVDVEELPRWRRRLTLVVAAERVARERQRLTQALARRLRIPGFRPGRAPAPLVRKRLGAEVEEELLSELLRDALREALEGRGLAAVAPPVVTSAAYEADGALRAVAELDVRPEVRLARVAGFRVERPDARVPPEAVDRVLQRLAEERAEVAPAGRPAARGDVVVADVEPLDPDAEPLRGYEVRLGSGEAGPEIEAQLEGVSAGETREVETGGRRWRVAAREVRERRVPPVDDAFAAAVSSATSLAELRERIADDLRREAEARSLAEQRERLIDAVAEANAVEVPESLVERSVERMLAPQPAGEAGRGQARGGGRGHAHGHRRDRPPAVEAPRAGDVDPEVARILRQAAERSLRRMLVVEAVARDQGLEPTDADLDAYLAERVEAGGAGEARRSLARAGRLEELRGHLRAENVYRFLEAQSELRPAHPAELPPRKE